jgi:NAD(P)-dependent dehydrogenase (short-subunit alcohol dehydrogenase family)
MDLADKVAIVTGAASGLGREIAVGLAAAGVRTVLGDIDLEACEETAQLCPNTGGRVTPIRADVTSIDDTRALVATAVSEYGALDCACNNAGVEGPTCPSGDLAEEDWQHVIHVNLTGVWLSMKAQLQHLVAEAKPGSIVNMSSMTGVVGVPGISPYVASKHGVIGLTKSAALEYASAEIRINALCPGGIHTQLIDRVLERNPETVEAMIQATPMRRLGKTEDVVNAVKWLFSDESSYMTGQSMVIDGGYTAQ